jgi:hypothetical protein
MTPPPAPLSEAWWDAVIEAWNASDYRQSLARFGVAAFHVTDAAAGPVWLHWDSDGRATRRTGGASDSPRFDATAANWTSFLRGEIGAGMAIVRLKIHFRGQVRRVLPYVGAFNNLARVCRPFVQ